MGELRIELLEERVTSLRERTEELQDEFESVRRRTRHLQHQDEGTTDRPLDASDGRRALERPRVRSDHELDPTTSGASDEEVAAAVQRVETETDDQTEDRDRTEIIVA